jgi:UDP-2,3-diacylglucosamine pyrophosphatase LpxH
MDYIIISDLHIGGNSELDIFHSQHQLSDFLTSFGSKPITLVINGDFIDFLAVRPFGIFSRDAAKQKIKTIIDAAPNQPLWAAFRSFLGANQQSRIDILLGNHDVEMVFEEVQEALLNTMAVDETESERERIQFKTDRLSHPKIEVGGVQVHIEHGFQYDLFNWYNHNKLIDATSFKKDGTLFELPIGSQLVYAVLNKLTPKHPFIPLLKPETAAFWLMAALAPQEIFRFLRKVPGMSKDMIINSMRKGVRGHQLGIKDSSAGLEESALQAQLVNMLLKDKSLSPATLPEVVEFLNNGTGKETASSKASFGFNPILRGKLFLIRRGLNTLKHERDAFFDTSQGDNFKKALGDTLELNAKVAVFGHSHGRKMLYLPKDDDPQRKLLYLNTGTWADLLDFDMSLLSTNAALVKWLEQLEKGKHTPTLVYTYAHLEELPGGSGARVSLKEWPGGKDLDGSPQEVFP